MASYYYLGAQLPYLIYGQDAPMSSEDFIALAKELMGSAAAALLDSCALDPDPAQAEGTAAGASGAAAGAAASYAQEPPSAGSKLLDRWREWERALRLNLAQNRAQKCKREGGALADAPAFPADAVGAAKNAMAIESPLEAEIFLDKARWNAIESFHDTNVFSESSIYAYLLKLLLMERRSVFRTEVGFNEYKGLYAAILGEAK